MSGSGTNGTNQTLNQTVSSSNLPSWENSAYQNVASQAFGQAYDPTTGLPNQLPAQQSIASSTDNFSNYLSNAMNAPNTGSNLSGSNAFAGYKSNIQNPTINNALSGYNANIQTTPVTSTNWDTAQANNYMSPYENTALQSQEQLANQQYGQQQAQLNQTAAASGALGGDRAAIQQSNLTNDFSLQQQNLQANALENAYTTGQTAFNNDANRNLQAGVENSQLGLASQIQNANLGFGALTAQNSTNQANAYLGMQAQEQNANNNLSALSGTNQLNTAAAGLGLSGLNAAGTAGLASQQYAQSQLDTSYQNAMNQYLFPEQQIGYSEGVLNGIPEQRTNQADYYTNTGNPYSQAAGSGKGGSKPSSGGGGGGGPVQPPSSNVGGNTKQPLSFNMGNIDYQFPNQLPELPQPSQVQSSVNYNTPFDPGILGDPNGGINNMLNNFGAGSTTPATQGYNDPNYGQLPGAPAFNPTQDGNSGSGFDWTGIQGGSPYSDYEDGSFFGS